MSDLADLRESFEHVQAALGYRSPSAVHGLYMEMAPLVGELQGAVNMRGRSDDPPSKLLQAEEALARCKVTMRQVGLDIRLSSPRSLTVGMRAATEEALSVLDLLEADP